MLFIPIIVSIFSLIFAYFLIKEINKAPSGSGKMIEISQAIKESGELESPAAVKPADRKKKTPAAVR